MSTKEYHYKHLAFKPQLVFKKAIIYMIMQVKCNIYIYNVQI